MAAESEGIGKRTFPPPCWSQEETSSLIAAYRERWYALNRGFLRSLDWEAVAAAVSIRCPDVIPPKTSAQCRHKMEKLRQRYKAEKRRSFSSWNFYTSMESLQFHNSTDESQNPLKLKLKSPNENTSGSKSIPNFDISTTRSTDSESDNSNRSRSQQQIDFNFESRIKKSGKIKKRRRGLSNVLDSIKGLGERFVKIEEMKMEMAREMEGIRIGMERKRNQIVIQSYKKIVDEVLKGVC